MRTDYVPPSHIAVINKSSTLPDRDAQLWVEAYTEEIKHCAEAWGLAPPGMALYPFSHLEEPDPAVAAVYIVDTAGEPDALGYHTAAGRSRFGYVDMTLSAQFDFPSVVFGHELYELFVDADVNRWAGPFADGTHIAIEVCDPVQRDFYQVRAEFIGNSDEVRVADFILPSWFDPSAAGPYAFKTSLHKSLEDAPGGYHVTERDGVVVTGAARVKSFGRTMRRLLEGRGVRVGDMTMKKGERP